MYLVNDSFIKTNESRKGGIPRQIFGRFIS